MNNTSESLWAKLDTLSEAEIDTSDIPPLTEDFLNKSRWWKPVVLSTRLKSIVFDTDV